MTPHASERAAQSPYKPVQRSSPGSTAPSGIVQSAGITKSMQAGEPPMDGAPPVDGIAPPVFVAPPVDDIAPPVFVAPPVAAAGGAGTFPSFPALRASATEPIPSQRQSVPAPERP